MSHTISCKNYSIFFGDWDAMNEMLNRAFTKKIIIVDENTVKHCLPVFLDKTRQTYDVITIPAGEEFKTITTAQYIWSEMLRLGVDRHSLCINLGGGVIGDMGGWASASFMRGIHFIQLPTTLLSMVDASVGGKLGIDFQGVKNIVGLIKDPDAVFIFTEFLETLTPELLRSGLAEILKHGLIQDAIYWNKVKNINVKNEQNWDNIIYESVLIKKEITEVDPYERGLRKILNFGHTIGHAIESLSFNHDVPLLHGEAIAIGMIAEAHLSHQKSLISAQSLYEITKNIGEIYEIHPTYIPPFHEVYALLKKDKKNKGGQIKFSLLDDIGHCLFDQQVSDEQIKDALLYYSALA